jgi:hypothetical protein
MKKKLLLLALLSYSTAFGSSGLLGSQLQYQDVVLGTAVLAVVYAFNMCDSIAKYGNVLKEYLSLSIAGAAGLAVIYSDQFNNMVPEPMRVNQLCDSVNTVLPYWFGVVIAAATYSKFCDLYDYYFIKPKKEENKDAPNFTLRLV